VRYKIKRMKKFFRITSYLFQGILMFVLSIASFDIEVKTHDKKQINILNIIFSVATLLLSLMYFGFLVGIQKFSFLNMYTKTGRFFVLFLGPAVLSCSSMIAFITSFNSDSSLAIVNKIIGIPSFVYSLYLMYKYFTFNANDFKTKPNLNAKTEIGKISMTKECLEIYNKLSDKNLSENDFQKLLLKGSDICGSAIYKHKYYTMGKEARIKLKSKAVQPVEKSTPKIASPKKDVPLKDFKKQKILNNLFAGAPEKDDLFD